MNKILEMLMSLLSVSVKYKTEKQNLNVGLTINQSGVEATLYTLTIY